MGSAARLYHGALGRKGRLGGSDRLGGRRLRCRRGLDRAQAGSAIRVGGTGQARRHIGFDGDSERQVQGSKRRWRLRCSSAHLSRQSTHGGHRRSLAIFLHAWCAGPHSIARRQTGQGRCKAKIKRATLGLVVVRHADRDHGSGSARSGVSFLKRAGGGVAIDAQRLGVGRVHSRWRRGGPAETERSPSSMPCRKS